jgi:hypothetical protein
LTKLLLLKVVMVMPSGLGVLDDDVAEEEAAGLADGSEAALQTGAEELLGAATVDGPDPHARRDGPDVHEGDVGELKAPAQRHGDAAQDKKDVVAAFLGAVEAAVGALLHAVDAVGALGLGQHILEGNLQRQNRTS